MFTVGIVVPTWHFFRDPFKLQPVEEMYFATVIDERFGGREVKASVIDLRELRRPGSPYALDKVAAYIPERDLYLYWIPRAGTYGEIISVIRQLREAYPRSRHAGGGFHIAHFVRDCQNHFDAVVVGPGEESFIRIINDCRKGSLKKVYKARWEDAHFSKYPFPRRDYLPEPSVISMELFKEYGDIRGTSALFTRGCPFKCGYCYHNYPNTASQLRDPRTIEAEIAYLKKDYNLKGVNLRDELCIPLSRTGAIRQLEAIGRQNVVWRGQGRVGTSKEIMKLARASGLIEIALGVESASQRVLDITRKQQTIRQAKDSILLCKSLGIKVKVCLMFGLPGEPRDIVAVTRAFLEETRPDYVNVSGFCPFPGTEIHDHFRRFGITSIDHDWKRYGHLIYRFSDDEDVGLPFEYEERNRWGKTFKRKEIIENIKELQHYLQEKNMVW